MSSTLMPGLDSSRSTCFIACLLARPRAAASPCPMAATASEAPCITPRVASHRLSMRLACRSAPSTPPSTWRTSLNENWLVMVALMTGSAAFGSWLRSRFGRWGPAKSGSAKTHDLNAGVAHSILFGIPSGRADSFIPTPSKAQNEGMPERVPCHPEPAAQIVPDRDAELVAGLGEAEESIPAVAAGIAACPGADLPPRDITADVVLRAVGVKRDLRPVQHHQQLSLVGMQPRQQAVQHNEAGAAEEDAVEPCTQCGTPARTGPEPVSLETGVETPDLAANPRLSGTMLVGKRVQLVHQPFRVNPAQRVPADVELPGIVAQDHRVAEELVRLNAAPQGALGGDPHGVGRDIQRGEAEPVEMRQPRGLIGEAGLRLRRQAGDQRRGQCMLSHVAVGRVVEHVIGMAGAQQIEEAQPALR